MGPLRKFANVEGGGGTIFHASHMVILLGLTQLPREALPINARAVAPGFPQARAGVCVVSGGAA